MARENEILQKIKQIMAFIGMSPTKKRSLADWICGPSLCEYSKIFKQLTNFKHKTQNNVYSI